MNRDGYNLYLERDYNIIDKKGNAKKLENSVFDGNSKNKFITVMKSKSEVSVKTPICRNIFECYSKFKEITNIALCELHKSDKLFLPCDVHNLLNCNGSNDNMIKILFLFDDKLVNKIRKLKSELPKDSCKVYERIKENFKNKVWMLKKVVEVELMAKENSIINDAITIDTISIENVNYLGINSIVNPFDKCGITKNYLKFLLVFLIDCMINDEKKYKETTEELLNEMDNFIRIDEELELKCKAGIIQLKDKVKTGILSDMFIDNDTIMELAKKNSEEAYNARYRIEDYPCLDGSAVALIKDALINGIDFNVIEEGKSFIELLNDKIKEYVVMATMTDKDSYILSYITDDKHFAKEVMAESELSVPVGVVIKRSTDIDERETLIKRFIGKPLVVKPRTTNSGVGISVFSEPISKEKLEDAIDYALKFDMDVLVEEFIEGNEYRFVVVNDKCISVCHRRSASVVGNGISTIHELIEEKNKEQWHSLLDNPVLEDKPAEDFLRHNGYSFEYVPTKDERIFLRENSNCSTGGESIDVTDKMPEKFKKIAEKASNCFGAKISGVDIIIDDLNSDKYSIIEINDNPGFSINEWPYEGCGEKIGESILRLLNLI